jgi:hypothetical protein
VFSRIYTREYTVRSRRFLDARADHAAGREAVARAVARASEAHRSAGRPPGAVNKSTAKLREYLLARGGQVIAFTKQSAASAAVPKSPALPRRSARLWAAEYGPRRGGAGAAPGYRGPAGRGARKACALPEPPARPLRPSRTRGERAARNISWINHLPPQLLTILS